jgi:hypothetical protein
MDTKKPSSSIGWMNGWIDDYTNDWMNDHWMTTHARDTCDERTIETIDRSTDRSPPTVARIATTMESFDRSIDE